VVEHGGQKVLHEAEKMSPTFNFLAGNQEAKENKALKRMLDQSLEGCPVEVARTAPTVPGIVRYFNVGQSWKG
jgi:hypothetical protein